jgi:hypothetical protein
MFVVESSFNSEAGRALLDPNACHFPNATDSNFLVIPIWRGQKNFNSNIRSNRWAPCAANERSIERNIACKTAFRLFATVHPVENDRKVQLVTHGGPALQFLLDELRRAGLHDICHSMPP